MTTAISNTSSEGWSTVSTLLIFDVFARRRSSDMTPCTAAASSAAVGQSRKMSRGALTSWLAIATRRTSAPSSAAACAPVCAVRLRICMRTRAGRHVGEKERGGYIEVGLHGEGRQRLVVVARQLRGRGQRGGRARAPVENVCAGAHGGGGGGVAARADTAG